MNFNLLQEPQQLQELDAKGLTQQMKELIEYLRVQIRVAQDRHEESTNKNRTPAPDLKVGDQVFLIGKNLRTTRTSRKLDWKNMGPFPIKRVISPYAYELHLPASMKIHPVRHVSLLELAPTDPLEGQLIPPPPPVIIEEMEEYAVEEILDSRVLRKQPQYLVRWVGYPHPSWEPAEYHTHTSAVTTYHDQYPIKLGPWYDEKGEEV
jgi:hypothetical protein